MPSRVKRPGVSRVASLYQHTQKTQARPEAGTQAHFKPRKPPNAYCSEGSLDSVLSRDGGNTARETGEWLRALVAEAAKLAAPHRSEQARDFTVRTGQCCWGSRDSRMRWGHCNTGQASS